MRILVVGAGSTGGYFGARLVQAGRDVTFLVRPRRAAELQHGLQVVSPLGDFTIAPQLVLANAINTTFDIILFTVKAYSLDSAITDVASAVGADTMILPVLNGMRHVDVLRDRFGADSVVGCACKVATSVDSQGRIVQLNTMQELVYGEMSGAVTARIEALHAALGNAAFTATLSGSIELEMWEKWTMLATLGGVTCLMRGNIGQIVGTQYGVDFILQFLDEVVATVTAEGHAPSDAFLSHLRNRLTEKHSPWTSSMYRDLQSGHQVEAEQILGDLILRARTHAVHTPLIIAAFANLSVYQAAVRGG